MYESGMRREEKRENQGSNCAIVCIVTVVAGSVQPHYGRVSNACAKGAIFFLSIHLSKPRIG